uniref:Anaphase-promoting complex subunit 4 WD40 domain-containing protein n=1 Tax=Ciona intestinalis TaxID=7719 RepID=F6RCG7_CIOIN
RESNSFRAHKFCNDNHVNEDMLHRLQLEKELVGHSGCVNCLEWNESGSILVSGSDDTNIILWDPSTRTPIKTYASTHHGNIFSVKFLPKTNDHFVATGAADNHVFVHDIERGEKIHGHRCDGRVKRLVVTPDHPNIIWSVSEDGAIRQFDMRQEPFAITRVLLDLSAMCGPSAEGKCLAINPTQTDYLALGANDQYVRLYDSKKKRRHDYDGCATYFTPAHLHHERPELKRRGKYLCTTYVAFNPKGDELLANLGGEQLYLFNIFNSDQSVYDPITETLTQINKQDQSSEIPSGRSLAFDYTKRYCGHCNTTTDIKEANFFGNNGQYIVAGSDDGSFFVWERATTNLVRVMRADDSIVNCLQPHPNTCMLATSGIDPIVRLWSP